MPDMSFVPPPSRRRFESQSSRTAGHLKKQPRSCAACSRSSGTSARPTPTWRRCAFPSLVGCDKLSDTESQGELRCDINVSVHRSSSPTLGARCEVKNLNGVRFLVGAISASPSFCYTSVYI